MKNKNPLYQSEIFPIQFLLLFLILLFSKQSQCQSSVYVCQDNDAIGYCFGNTNSQTCALEKFENHGGINPLLVYQVSDKGWSAIAIGRKNNGRRAVGIGGPFPTREEAEASALEYCEFYGGDKCRVWFVWNDKEAKDDKTKTTQNEKVDQVKKNFWNGHGTPEEEELLKKRTAKKPDNQYIGEIECKTSRIKVKCRDHGKIDGDRVKILHNGKAIETNLVLTESYISIPIKLKFGMNRIDFVALNEGTDSPNTAEFKVIDYDGKEVSTKNWNIETGFKGTLLILKL